jgi:hypothetical protein
LAGLPLAVELVRIAADEASALAPAEAAELQRVLSKLEAHRDGVAHVHYEHGVSMVWRE